MKFLKYTFLAGLALTALWQAPVARAGECNPLVDAAAAGNMPEVKAYVEVDRRLHIPNYPVWSTDWMGNTPLHAAARNGQTAVAQYLLDKGACPCQRNWGPWETPLFDAAEAGKLDIVKLLVEHGAKLDVRNKWGVTPLHLAAAKGNLDVVKYLVSKTARMDAECEGGHTALWEAVANDKPEVVAFLLWAGSPVGTYDMQRHQILEVAKSDAVKDMLRHRGCH